MHFKHGLPRLTNITYLVIVVATELKKLRYNCMSWINPMSASTQTVGPISPFSFQFIRTYLFSHFYFSFTSRLATATTDNGIWVGNMMCNSFKLFTSQNLILISNNLPCLSKVIDAQLILELYNISLFDNEVDWAFFVKCTVWTMRQYIF